MYEHAFLFLVPLQTRLKLNTGQNVLEYQWTMWPLLECNLVFSRTTRQGLGTSPERSVEIQDENAP